MLTDGKGGGNLESYLMVENLRGLKKLIEHIWKVIGIASTCEDMKDLKRKMEELYGKRPGFQYSLKLVPYSEHNQ